MVTTNPARNQNQQSSKSTLDLIDFPTPLLPLSWNASSHSVLNNSTG